MPHGLTSKRTWALTALAATVLAAAPSAVSAALPAENRPLPHGLHLDFSGDPEAFGGIGTVTAGRSTAPVGTAYDLCNRDSMSLRTDLVFCAGVIRLVSGAKGSISFESAAPRPGLAARYPIHFDGSVTGGTGRFKGLRGQLNFTQTGRVSYDVTFS